MIAPKNNDCGIPQTIGFQRIQNLPDLCIHVTDVRVVAVTQRNFFHWRWLSIRPFFKIPHDLPTIVQRNFRHIFRRIRI